jgi:hypothetical protein
LLIFLQQFHADQRTYDRAQTSRRRAGLSVDLFDRFSPAPQCLKTFCSLPR